MNVGFAGIGIMGHGMTKNLVNAGHDVYVYNRTREKAEAVAGATVVDSPLQLCNDADIIIVCVSNDQALRDVLFGTEGIFKTIDSKHILIDSGTTSLQLTEEIAAKCAEKNIGFLDAPVTGGQNGAEQGTLLYMVGGESETFGKALPLFEAMGSRIVHCGPAGHGQKVKHALNWTQTMVLQSYLEGLALALKGGVAFKAIKEVLDNSGASSKVADAKMPAIMKHNWNANFYLELMHKDVKLAEDDMKQLGIELRVGSQLADILQECMDQGWGRDDWVKIAKLLEDKTGVSFKTTS